MNERMQIQMVDVDHFGVASAGLIRDLLNMSSNKRVRSRSAKALFNMAQNSSTVPRGAKLLDVGVLVDVAGQNHLTFFYEPKEESHDPVEA